MEAELPMRSILIRRHSYTKKGAARGKGSHLSAAGVALARRIGAESGPFDLVFTSTVPRALETAIAMGFAVDEQLDVLGDIPPGLREEVGHHDRWAWETPFVRFAELIAGGGATARLGEIQRETWVEALECVPPAGRVLIISHGTLVEAGLVTCIPHGDFAAWGLPFRHLEGVELQYEDGQFTAIRFLRVEQPRP